MAEKSQQEKDIGPGVRNLVFTSHSQALYFDFLSLSVFACIMEPG